MTAMKMQYGKLCRTGRWWKIAMVCGGLCTTFTSCLSPLKPATNAGLTGTSGFHVATIQERIYADTMIGVENPLIVDPVDRRIWLYGAGRESVYFQVIIPAGTPDGTTLQIDPLKRTGAAGDSGRIISIDPARWRVFQILSVPAENADAVTVRLDGTVANGWQTVPDALSEIAIDKASAFLLPKGSNENMLLLLQVSIPQGLSRGDYAGQITIKSAGRTLSRPVTLRCWGFDLPESQTGIFGELDVSKVWTELGLGSLRDRDRLILPPDAARVKPLSEAIGPYCRILDECGIEPWLVGVCPRISVKDTDDVNIDWDGYRLLVDTVLKSSSRSRKFWPAPMDLSYPAPQVFGPYSSPTYQRMLRRYLGQFNDRVLKAGVAGKGVVIPAWVDDYRQGLDIYGAFVGMAREVYRSEQPVMVVNPFIPTDLRPLGWPAFKPLNKVKEYTRILCPGEKWLDPYATKSLRREGKLVWWRPMPSEGTVPSVKASYPRFLPQALAWTAWRYESQGVVLGKVNGWGRESATASGGSSKSESVLVYPGKWFGQDKPLGSLRLKMIHAGLQDISYLRALDRSGKRDLADWLARHLVRFAHTDTYDGSLWSTRNDGLCTSEQAWSLARVIAGYELSNRAIASTTQPADLEQRRIIQKLLTNQFRERTEGVTLETDGVRAKNVLDTQTGDEKVEWTFHTVARNFTDNEGGGQVQFVNPAASLRITGDSVNVGRLAWAWPVRTELTLESPSVTMGMFGVNVQPISLKRGDGTETLLNCRYCALAAQKLDRPVSVDGEFDDWPESPTSVAGNFVRIRPDGINERQLESMATAATWATTVRIGYTPQAICFAFICYEPKDRLMSLPSNSVASSMGLPWGEDLAAIVLDPDNSRSLNPLDAYHLIVKANGNVIGLRGTVEAGAMRAASAWANNVRAAVRVYDDRWQAEVAVPLSDLNASGKLNRWWGVDFSRFSAAISEMSTWSGVKSPSCKPISLGNVFMAK